MHWAGLFGMATWERGSRAVARPFFFCLGRPQRWTTQLARMGSPIERSERSFNSQHYRRVNRLARTFSNETTVTDKFLSWIGFLGFLFLLFFLPPRLRAIGGRHCRRLVVSSSKFAYPSRLGSDRAGAWGGDLPLAACGWGAGSHRGLREGSAPLVFSGARGGGGCRYREGVKGVGRGGFLRGCAHRWAATRGSAMTAPHGRILIPSWLSTTMLEPRVQLLGARTRLDWLLDLCLELE